MNLLKLVNTEEGKHLLGLIGQKPQNKIVHVTENSFIEHLGGDHFQATFLSRNPIYKMMQPLLDILQVEPKRDILKQYDLVKRYGYDPEFYQFYRYRFLTGTFNPAAGAVSPVDGRLVQSDNTTWALARSSTGATPDVTEGAITVCQGETVGGTFNIARCVFLFDTSSLTTNATISAATYSLYSHATFNNTETINPANLSLVACTPAATNTLATGDYNVANWGTTKFATDVTLTAFVASVAYSDMAMNADGLAAISKTGVTKIGIRASNDIAGDLAIPVARSFAFGNYADVGTNLPKLVVTYTLPGGAAIFMTTNTKFFGG